MSNQQFPNEIIVDIDFTVLNTNPELGDSFVLGNLIDFINNLDVINETFLIGFKTSFNTEDEYYCFYDRANLVSDVYHNYQNTYNLLNSNISSYAYTETLKHILRNHYGININDGFRDFFGSIFIPLILQLRIIENNYYRYVDYNKCSRFSFDMKTEDSMNKYYTPKLKTDVYDGGTRCIFYILQRGSL